MYLEPGLGLGPGCTPLGPSMNGCHIFRAWRPHKDLLREEHDRRRLPIVAAQMVGHTLEKAQRVLCRRNSFPCYLVGRKADTGPAGLSWELPVRLGLRGLGLNVQQEQGSLRETGIHLGQSIQDHYHILPAARYTVASGSHYHILQTECLARRTCRFPLSYILAW